MLTCSQQNAGKNPNIKAVNRFFEIMAKLKYLGKKNITNQNLIHEEIKRRLI
jgi:hypothetical protein